MIFVWLQMEGELGDLSRDNKAFQLAMAQKDLRLDATLKDMLHERQSVQDLKVELKNIKAGLHNTSRFIQEPNELKETVKELYRRHLRDFDQVRFNVNVNCKIITKPHACT